jgi:hypothetical protein
MKKLLIWFVLLFLFTSCTAKVSDEKTTGEIHENDASAYPLAATEPSAGASTASALSNIDLNVFVEQLLHESGKHHYFSLSYENEPHDYDLKIYDFENITAYHTTGDMGYNLIMYYDKLHGEWGVADLIDDKYAYYKVRAIQSVYNRPDLIAIACESYYSDGGYAFRNYNSYIHYSISDKQIEEIIFRAENGRYGMANYSDKHRFAECYTVENKAIFTFELIPGPSSTGLPGPEIIVERGYNFDTETSDYMFAFCNTYLNLSEDFLRQMREMEGVASVEVSYAESLVFTGAQLVICPQPGYQVETIINQSGNTMLFEDFSLRCVPIDGRLTISETTWKIINSVPVLQ